MAYLVKRLDLVGISKNVACWFAGGLLGVMLILALRYLVLEFLVPFLVVMGQAGQPS